LGRPPRADPRAHAGKPIGALAVFPRSGRGGRCVAGDCLDDFGEVERHWGRSANGSEDDDHCAVRPEAKSAWQPPVLKRLSQVLCDELAADLCITSSTPREQAPIPASGYEAAEHNGKCFVVVSNIDGPLAIYRIDFCDRDGLTAATDEEASTVSKLLGYVN